MIDWYRQHTKLDRRQKEISERMNSGNCSTQELTELAQEYAERQPVLECLEKFAHTKIQIKENQALLTTEIDNEFRTFIQQEIDSDMNSLSRLEHQIKIMLLEKDSVDDKGIILEVRAGTGGIEAALFASDLLRMYLRFAQIQNWQVQTLEHQANDLGGVSQAVIQIDGRGVYGKLKFESGGHRVQRVPCTESSGRIHTSAATVAVLPQVTDTEVVIADKDIRIDTYRAQGAGGQHVNTTDSAVRITHLPSKIVVQCQDEKSQHKNRAKAMKILRSRIYEHIQEQIIHERSKERRIQIGSGDRSGRIRTYNFPQTRVTDHRIGLSLHNLTSILAGEGLNELIEALIVQDQTFRLAKLANEE